MTLVYKRLKKHALILLKVLYKKEIIINYQMGKVGSSSVARYLRENDIFEWHVHRFYDTPVHRRKDKNVFLKVIDLCLLKLVLWRCSKVFVISGFREPVSRDISMFFHNIGSYYKDVEVGRRSTKDLIKLFVTDFAIGDCVDWFKLELNRAFHINVYAHDYSPQKGFMRFSNGNTSFFIYDVRRLSTLDNELSSFLNLPTYKVLRDNIAENKKYNEAYKDFQSQFFLDDSIYKKLLASDYMCHFYSKVGSEKILSRWVEKGGA